MNAPKLRFAGFKGDWEERKLGEIAEIKDSARISNEFWINKGIPYLRSSDLVNDDLKGELFISKETYDKYSLQTGAPQKDDVLFTSGGKVGVAYHKEDNSLVYVQGGAVLYVRTSTSEKLDGSFLSVYFTNHRMKKYMENASVGGTIKHFTLKPANAAPIIFPSIKEQKKIGYFFKKLDKKIQLQQEKIDFLKQQKKGFMQKIFSQELRFKDDNGQEFPEWETKNLNDLIKVNSGRDYKHLEPGDIPVYGTGGYMLSVNEYLSKQDAVGIGRKGTINAPQKLKAPFWTVDTLFYCTPKKLTDFNFIFLLFQHINWTKYDESTGVPSLSKKTIESITYNIPSYEEQKLIGSLFVKLDMRIDLEVKKLGALQTQKLAFMQQMFI